MWKVFLFSCGLWKLEPSQTHGTGHMPMFCGLMNGMNVCLWSIKWRWMRFSVGSGLTSVLWLTVGPVVWQGSQTARLHRHLRGHDPRGNHVRAVRRQGEFRQLRSVGMVKLKHYCKFSLAVFYQTRVKNDTWKKLQKVGMGMCLPRSNIVEWYPRKCHISL